MYRYGIVCGIFTGELIYHQYQERKYHPISCSHFWGFVSPSFGPSALKNGSTVPFFLGLLVHKIMWSFIYLVPPKIGAILGISKNLTPIFKNPLMLFRIKTLLNTMFSNIFMSNHWLLLFLFIQVIAVITMCCNMFYITSSPKDNHWQKYTELSKMACFSDFIFMKPSTRKNVHGLSNCWA